MNAEAAMGHWDSSIKHLTLPWDAHGIRMVCATHATFTDTLKVQVAQNENVRFFIFDKNFATI